MNLLPKFSPLRAAAALALLPGLVLTPAVSYATGVGALSAATATSAREAPVAAPVVSLTGGEPSQSASIAASKTSETSAPPVVTSSGTRTSSTTTTTRTSSRGGTVAPSGKGVVIDKNPVYVEPPAPGPEIAFTAGWDSTYMFKGLDNVANSSGFHEHDVGIWYGKVSLAYEGWGFFAGYLQADEETNPRFDPSANARDHYSEILLGANYTASIIGGVLDGTIGYNAYFFPNDDFWSVGYQGELWARIAYVQIPHITPNVVYSYFHADEEILTGSFFEFRLDSNWDLYDGGSFRVGINPYALISYDIEYNHEDGSDWAGVEVGLRIPIAIGDNLIVALSANYGWDAGDERTDYPDGDEGFWGGASVTYRF